MNTTLETKRASIAPQTDTLSTGADLSQGPRRVQSHGSYEAQLAQLSPQNTAASGGQSSPGRSRLQQLSRQIAQGQTVEAQAELQAVANTARASGDHATAETAGLLWRIRQTTG